VPRAGHAAPIERPDAVARELEAFFARVREVGAQA